MKSTKEKIINILIDNKDKYISGESISEKLEVSRASVWKHIKNLEKEGYQIESKTSQGYKLIGRTDTANPSYEISHRLKTSFMGQRVDYFKTIDSTNIQANKIASQSPEGTVVLADEQTKGKGRIGRTWVSEQNKGLYFSTILKPDIALMQAPFITQLVAASLTKTFLDLGIEISIKWPNDLIYKGKKVAGILTEMSAEIDHISYIIVGIGINLYKKDFEDEIKDKATSFANEGIEIDRIEFLRKFFPNFEDLYEKFKAGDKRECLDILRSRSAVLGREVYKIKEGERVKVFARDIDDMGNLIVEHESGQVETVFTGEISIRGLDSYI
ncbi:biotin--[acetyl-CoA-carboxylase] ligase [Peptostreptococcus anaerobius]|uniref:Bifunctional ligase/repressor BirA n=1 Tax=Peptostreptococcus anaerobius 653-L TaxID=596329 RepID=D3MQ71_9FIRM|nr:biotin--[acetyl-CoA-carboxylase] ligase [Peptostreptococcus anaerobius]EFD05718.1 biotin--[acetyl-CoA-carboxylase] ligase [Peptostreptococcus anaerobius 653-L]